eukprot:scaffold14281_cov19-Tisochrysis_lutea.AAC.2
MDYKYCSVFRWIGYALARLRLLAGRDAPTLQTLPNLADVHMAGLLFTLPNCRQAACAIAIGCVCWQAEVHNLNMCVPKLTTETSRPLSCCQQCAPGYGSGWGVANTQRLHAQMGRHPHACSIHSETNKVGAEHLCGTFAAFVSG